MSIQWSIYGYDLKTGHKRSIAVYSSDKQGAIAAAISHGVKPAHAFRSDQLIEPPKDFQPEQIDQPPKQEQHYHTRTSWTSEPCLNDFGLTVNDAIRLNGSGAPATISQLISMTSVFACIIITCLLVAQLEDDYCTCAFGFFVVAGSIFITHSFIKHFNSKGGRGSEYERYQDYLYAVDQYRHKRNTCENEVIARERTRLADEKRELLRKGELWTRLNPYDFEIEVAKLFIRCGYEAKVTTGSNDGGVDVKAVFHGRTVAIQCKQHKGRCPPSYIRELIGVRHDMNYDYAILICTGGFSHNAIDLAERNGIITIDTTGLISMNNGTWQPLVLD